MRDISEVKLEHIPDTIEAKPLGLTVIGSHMWGMNHEASDVDAMAIVQEPTERILRRKGRLQTTSVFKTEHDGWPIDLHIHEIGRTVDFLLNSNINFLVGVLSPIVVYEEPRFGALRKLTRDNLSRNTYQSIHGMAVQNMARYAGIPRGTFYTTVLSELVYTPIEERRCGKMLAYLEFGINLMEGKGPVFQKPEQYPWSTEGVVEAIKDLDMAFVSSKLPPKPDDTKLRDFLLESRELDLDGW